MKMAINLGCIRPTTTMRGSALEEDYRVMLLD